jgi:hypothetical protein
LGIERMGTDEALGRDQGWMSSFTGDELGDTIS